ncbi:molybdenum cofactor biosynthesis prote [Auriculariales sp. MPI-PUGE-AT-0066]|nr:molybdenum cofactor biosynthesis prote [Auriculariales sp. MPI-PUGE-AT-0066]
MTSLSALNRYRQESIARIDASRPSSHFLTDSFQREHNYLRISLTERCNLRCFYCMPEEGVELSPASHILTDDEVIRLAELFVRHGVNKIRLTGGEPTVRRSLPDLISRLTELEPLGLRTIAMTSNGISLRKKLPDLVDRGLTHLNLSLDTMDPFKFELMARRPATGHSHVLSTLDLACTLPSLRHVKVNVVVIRGLNDGELQGFVELTRERPITIRFIEFMPFSGNKWDKAKMVPSAELLQQIRMIYPTLAKNMDGDHDTSSTWHVPGYAGSAGFISSMSDHFCGTCNRSRLTADGQFKVCLFDPKEVSLRDLMRAGASDDELMQVIGRAIQGKKAKHAGMDMLNHQALKNRPMILIALQPSRPLLSPLPRGLTRSCDAQLRPSRSAVEICPVGVAPSSLRTFSTCTSATVKSTSLTHIKDGRPHMVDVSHKQITARMATARGQIRLPASALKLLLEASNTSPTNFSKGNPLVIAQLAAISGVKRTAELITLCHPALPVTHVEVSLLPDEARSAVVCEATVRSIGRTGVEMEALTAVNIALLNVWDCMKAVAGQEMVMEEIKVVRKAGGKSGDWQLEDA